MKYITLRIPIIDTGDSVEQKRRKMLEELDELLDEFSVAPIDIRDAISEFFDVAQVMVTYVLAEEKRQDLSLDASVDLMTRRLEIGNEIHIDKMEDRSVERGWKVVE